MLLKRYILCICKYDNRRIFLKLFFKNPLNQIVFSFLKVRKMIINLKVSDDFVIPKLFETLSPEDTAHLLCIAGRVHELFLEEYKNTSQKISDAKLSAVSDTIEKVLEQAKKIEFEKFSGQLSEFASKNEELKNEINSLKILVETKNLENRYLKENSGCTKEYLNSKEAEQLGYQKGYEECKERSVEDLKDLKEKSKLLHESQLKIQELQDSVLKIEQTKNEAISKLKDENAKLNTPMAKGENGEYVVEETLKNARFHVHDTSKTPYKEQGYLDRIVTEDGNFPPISGWSIAIEVKNKKRLVKSADIEAFKKKSEDGISSGKFTASIFLSIDDSLGINSSSIEFVNDESGIPIGPVAFYSPSTGTNSFTQEQVVLCVQQHIHMIKHCNNVRSLLFNQSAKDEDVKKIQSFFNNYVKETRENFEEFGEMTKTALKMNLLLEKKKKKMFEQFKTMESISSSVSWLNTSFNIPLNTVYDSIRARYEGNKNWTKSQIFSKTANIPLLHNQLGTENAWDIMKKQSLKDCESVVEGEEEEEDALITDTRVPDVESSEEDANLLIVCSQVYEHIKRKRSTKSDYGISSVSLATLATNIRDSVRTVGGVDVVKRFFRENSEKWPDADVPLTSEPPKKKSKA